MLDLRDDGTIGIDFEDGQPTVVLARPKFGQYKRLRSEAQRRVDALNARLTELRAQDVPPSLAEMNEEIAVLSEQATTEWWALVLSGDETFKALTTSGAVPPVDDWPPYLVYGTNVINEVLGHWRSTPLARGGRLVTETPVAE